MKFTNFSLICVVLSLEISYLLLLISRLRVVLCVSIVQLLKQRLVRPLQVVVCRHQITDLVFEIPNLLIHS